jgi:hypothetical protein
LDLSEHRSLSFGELFGGFEQHPAGVLDPQPADVEVGAHGPGVVSADVVDRGARERDHVEGVMRDLGLGQPAADGAGVGSDMSIETARMESLRSPSSTKNSSSVAPVRPGALQMIPPVS